MNLNLNLKMTVERSKRRSQFLSLVFITKCFNKNLLLKKAVRETYNNFPQRDHFFKTANIVNPPW